MRLAGSGLAGPYRDRRGQRAQAIDEFPDGRRHRIREHHGVLPPSVVDGDLVGLVVRGAARRGRVRGQLEEPRLLDELLQRAAILFAERIGVDGARSGETGKCPIPPLT